MSYFIDPKIKKLVASLFVGQTNVSAVYHGEFIVVPSKYKATELARGSISENASQSQNSSCRCCLKINPTKLPRRSSSQQVQYSECNRCRLPNQGLCELIVRVIINQLERLIYVLSTSQGVVYPKLERYGGISS